jgi:hypothetical protein
MEINIGVLIVIILLSIGITYVLYSNYAYTELEKANSDWMLKLKTDEKIQQSILDAKIADLNSECNKKLITAADTARNQAIENYYQIKYKNEKLFASFADISLLFLEVFKFDGTEICKRSDDTYKTIDNFVGMVQVAYQNAQAFSNTKTCGETFEWLKGKFNESIDMLSNLRDIQILSNPKKIITLLKNINATFMDLYKSKACNGNNLDVNYIRNHLRGIYQKICNGKYNPYIKDISDGMTAALIETYNS